MPRIATNNNKPMVRSPFGICRDARGRLDVEWVRARRTGSDVALMMIDVDRIETLNETSGGLDGDACLRRIDDVLATVALDHGGFAGRYGGKTVWMLLPDADVAAGHRAGETIRAAVQALAIPHAGSIARRITVSVGVASIAPRTGLQAHELVQAADAALHAARQGGGNRVAGHGLIAFEGIPLALTG